MTANWDTIHIASCHNSQAYVHRRRKREGQGGKCPPRFSVEGAQEAPFHKNKDYYSSIISLSRQLESMLAGLMWLGIYIYYSTI